MKRIVIIIPIFFIASCIVQTRSTVSYKRQKVEGLESRHKYVMEIPKDYKLVTLVGGHQEIEKQYVYSDSSKIYISDFLCSILNYYNIKSLGDSVSTNRLQSVELKAELAKDQGKSYLPETIKLEGRTQKGYWKDIRIGFVSLGYVNVLPDRKKEFDLALESLTFLENE